MNIKTICNPININYQYQGWMRSRESADPAIVIYQDEYYLFASRGSGYWVSDDLANWEFIRVDTAKNPEFDLYAPGPVVVGNRLYLTHSQGGCMLYSNNPRDPDLDDNHTPDHAFDEWLSSWWSAKSGDADEWLEVDLGKVYDVCSLQVNFADQDIAPNISGRGLGFAYRYTVEASLDGQDWFMLIDQRQNPEDRSHEYFQLDDITQIRYLKLTNCGTTPGGGKFAVSGLRVFGYGGGSAPDHAPEFHAVRCADERNMQVSWKPVEGAQGYMIRFGINPKELHTHWQVIGECAAEIGSLTRDVTYYVTVDAYNESGTVYGTTIQQI